MNLSTLAMIIVFSLVTYNLREQMDTREQQVNYDTALATFTQLALAQYKRSTDFADPSNPSVSTLKGYADTPQKLVDDGYLGVFNDPLKSWKFNTSASHGLTITFNAGDVYSAQQITMRLGNLATTSGTVVSVAFADPVGLALLNGFVKREGDTMLGALAFTSGKGGLNLADNHIVRVGKITAKEGKITSFEATTITGVQDLDAVNIDGVETLKVTDGVGRIESKAIVTDTILTSEIRHIP